jgi:hypothetical protein
VSNLVSRATFAPFVREIDTLLQDTAASLSTIAQQSHGGAQLKSLRAKLAQEKIEDARIDCETTGEKRLGFDVCRLTRKVPFCF